MVRRARSGKACTSLPSITLSCTARTVTTWATSHVAAVKVRRSEPSAWSTWPAPATNSTWRREQPLGRPQSGPPMSSDGVRIGRSTTVTVSPAAGERVRRTV